MSPRRLSLSIAALAALVCAVSVHARHTERETFWIRLDDAPPVEQTAPPDWVAEDDEESLPDVVSEEAVDPEIETLLGARWHELGGITAEYVYTGEVFNLARGGLDTRGATRYRGDLDLVVTMDTEKSQWWRGGEFRLYAFQTHGRTLTESFIGDGQCYSNIDTMPKPADETQLGEYWYQHTFGDSGLSVKVGKQDANVDFAYGDLGGDFVNSSFTLVPNVPLPTWPLATMGISGFVESSEWWKFGAGVYEGGEDRGQYWFQTESGSGVFAIAQLDVRPAGDCLERLPAAFRLGTWFKSADTFDWATEEYHESNYGFYALADQMLWVQDEGGRGLGLFAQYAWSPPDRNMVEHFFGGGVSCRGLLPRRAEDITGVGLVKIWFAEALRASDGMTSEDAWEAFHKIQLTRWATLQPDVQYIVNPSGNGRDALVAGVRCEMAL